jgi:signal transduction histidine kinase
MTQRHPEPPNNLADAVVELERLRIEVAGQHAQSERLASAGRLVAMLRHELGNPVSAIVNYAHTLEQKVPDDLRGTVASLQREAFRIVKLRDGFLDFVRPKSEGGGHTDAGADLNEAVRETLGFLGDQGALKRIELDVPSRPTRSPRAARRSSSSRRSPTSCSTPPPRCGKAAGSSSGSNGSTARN